MKFRVDFIAVSPPDTEAAEEFVREVLGGTGASSRTMELAGRIEGAVASATLRQSSACLRSVSLELNDYSGPNWRDLNDGDPHGVAALGMFCTAEEFGRWSKHLTAVGLDLVQEFRSGPDYFQRTFSTHHLLGFDLQLVCNLEA